MCHILSRPLWRPSSLNGQFPSSRHWHFSYQTAFGHRERNLAHPLFKYCQRRIFSWYPDTPLPPSAPPSPYTLSPAATLCCPWCFIISWGVCGPPLLSFDGVQTVKAWRQPANFPCCDSPTARGRAIFPLHQSQAYIPLMRKLSALLSTTAYLNCPLFCLSDYFVLGVSDRPNQYSVGRRMLLWALLCCSGRPPEWFNLQFDLIIETVEKEQYLSMIARHYYSQLIRKCIKKKKKIM